MPILVDVNTKRLLSVKTIDSDPDLMLLAELEVETEDLLVTRVLSVDIRLVVLADNICVLIISWEELKPFADDVVMASEVAGEDEVKLIKILLLFSVNVVNKARLPKVSSIGDLDEFVTISKLEGKRSTVLVDVNLYVFSDNPLEEGSKICVLMVLDHKSDAADAGEEKTLGLISMEVLCEAVEAFEAEGEPVFSMVEPVELSVTDPANETIELSIVFEGECFTDLLALKGITPVIFEDAENVEISGVLIHVVVNDWSFERTFLEISDGEKLWKGYGDDTVCTKLKIDVLLGTAFATVKLVTRDIIFDEMFCCTD